MNICSTEIYSYPLTFTYTKNFSFLPEEAVSLKSSQVAQRKQLIEAATASPELIKVKQMVLVKPLGYNVFSYHFALTNHFISKNKLLCISVNDRNFQLRD